MNPLFDRQLKEKDLTQPYMKGFCLPPELKKESSFVESSLVLGNGSDDGQENNQDQEKDFRESNQELELDCTKESDKSNLSKSAIYYQNLLDRHPELKAFDDERGSLNYQKKMKSMLSEVRKMLKKNPRFS